MRWLPAAVLVLLPACQKEAPKSAPAAPAASVETGPAKGTTEWKIQNAMSGGPERISANATIVDWGATSDAPPTQIRAGTNSWTCFPDMPQTPANDPTCADPVWIKLFEAWLGKKPFHTAVAGIGYMLQGGASASNTDPYKMAPDSGQQWMTEPPHLMLLNPDPRSLDSLSTDPANGGPYVMWKGTPYAHVMVPLQ